LTATRRAMNRRIDRVCGHRANMRPTPCSSPPSSVASYHAPLVSG
jgi:hypothetical protein